MQKIINNVIIAVAILAVVLVATIVTVQHHTSKRAHKELALEGTPNIIAEIKSISELTTAVFYEEVVIHEQKKGLILKDDIVIIAEGKVRAGFDLSKLHDEDIDIQDTLLTIRVPKAKILDVLVNPSDFDIYIEDGKWSDDEIVSMKRKAKEKIRKDALKSELLKKAEANGIEKLTELFKTFGYEHVNIVIKS